MFERQRPPAPKTPCPQMGVPEWVIEIGGVE